MEIKIKEELRKRSDEIRKEAKFLEKLYPLIHLKAVTGMDKQFYGLEFTEQILEPKFCVVKYDFIPAWVVKDKRSGLYRESWSRYTKNETNQVVIRLVIRFNFSKKFQCSIIITQDEIDNIEELFEKNIRNVDWIIKKHLTYAIEGEKKSLTGFHKRGKELKSREFILKLRNENKQKLKRSEAKLKELRSKMSELKGKKKC